MYLVETNSLALLKFHNEAIWKRRLAAERELVAITIITVEEHLNGWYGLLRRSHSPTTLAAVYDRITHNVSFLAGLPLITFSEAAIHRYESLRSMRLNVGQNDLRIAAIALENHAVVVTRNIRDCLRVPDLLVEDWTQ